MNTWSQEGLFPSIDHEFVMIPCLFSVSRKSPWDSGVANDEKTDNQNDAEKVQKILSSIFKKMIIYEACCLVNFTFCCSSASIWL